jgi:hypothetical protein
METIFMKVMCSDRLPTEHGLYITNRGLKTLFSGGRLNYNYWKVKVTWWLEEVPINTIKADAWDEGFNEAYEFYPIYEDLPNKPTNPYK